MKKFKLIIALLSMVILPCIWSCGSRDNSSTSTSNIRNSDHTTIYRCTDAIGTQYDFTVNWRDHTVKVTTESDSKTYYGGWSHYLSTGKNACRFNMSDIIYSFAWPDGNIGLSLAYFDDSKGYLYKNSTDYDAGNPNKRLKMKKLNN